MKLGQNLILTLDLLLQILDAFLLGLSDVDGRYYVLSGLMLSAGTRIMPSLNAYVVVGLRVG
jgi:hypothetical protein